MTPEGKRHVFLVDDNELFRKMVGDITSALDCNLLEAADGPEALDLIRFHASTLDVLLIDLVLPSMNGVELLESLRRSPGPASALPAVMLTGAAPDQQLTVELKTLHAAHLDKSHTVNRLRPMLENLFRRLQEAGR